MIGPTQPGSVEPGPEQPDDWDTPQRAEVRAALIDWFRVNGRTLPWRERRTPYATWISEIMLQQTQVESVRPYFDRFMQRFPTVEALAKAPEEEVLRYWAGLGYYSRARNLHRAARLVQSRSGGELPRKVEELLALPGIGRYTAGAIASIAYGERAPLLDGNVMRVLCRILALRGDPRSGETNRRLWRAAESLVAGPDPGGLNESLMELGALICIPGVPRCGLCPVSAWCRAFEQGLQTTLPERTPDAAPEFREHAALVVRRGCESLLQHRTVERIWNGLWCFPTDFPESPQATGIPAGPNVIAVRLGLRGLEPRAAATVRHGVMGWRITLRVFEVIVEPGRLEPPPDGFRWVRLEDLEALPMPAPHRRVARLLLEKGSRLPL